MLLLAVAPLLARAQTFSQAEGFADFGEWDWSGSVRAQVNLIVEQKPSSVRGQPRTDWGSLKFESRLNSREEPVAVVIGAHLGPERDTTHREPIFAWDQLKLEWTAGPVISMGLLQDQVVDFAWGSFWGSDYGADFEPGLSKWKIIPRSDLGLAIGGLWGEVAWNFQVSNGEGWPQAETGARKDFEFLVGQTRTWSQSRGGAQLFVRSGGYDQLGDNDNVKERAGLQAYYEGEAFTVGGLGAWLRDSVDGISGVVGEGADLSARGGEINQGSLLEGHAGYRWGEGPRRWRAFARAAIYKVDDNDSNKHLKQTALGVSRALGRSGMSVALTYQATEFGPNYATLNQDRSRWMLSWAWGLTRRGTP